MRRPCWAGAVLGGGLAAGAAAQSSRDAALEGAFEALMETAQPATLGRPNGWEFFERAAQLQEELEMRIYRESADSEHPIGFWPQQLYVQSSRWSDVLVAECVISHWDEFQARCTFDLVDEGVRAGRWIPIPRRDDRVSFVFHASARAIRSMATSQAARFWLATLRGDDDEMVRAWRACIAVLTAAEAVPSSIGRMVANSVAATVREAAASGLSHEPSERVLAEMAEPCAWLASRDQAGSFERVLQGERQVWKQVIGGLYDEAGRLKLDQLNSIAMMERSLLDAFTLDEPPAPDSNRERWRALLSRAEVRAGAIAFASLDETDRALDVYFDAAIDGLAADDPVERACAIRETLGPRHLVLHVMLERWEKAQRKSSRITRDAEADWHALKVMVAIERFKRQHGVYPDSLSSLVPELQSQVPRDRFTGMEFGYRRTDVAGQQGAGRGYVLYSFGPDRLDNGSHASSTAPDRLPHHAAANEDFVYSR